MAAYECNKILEIRNTESVPFLSGIFSTIFVIATYLLLSISNDANVIALTMSIASVASMTWMLYLLESTPKFIHNVAGLIAPALYTGGILTMAVMLREDKNGLALIFYLITLTSAVDTGAYLIGKLTGKTPFFPQISPSKTWEGSIGGMICAVIASVLFGIVVSETNVLDISLTHSVLVGILIGFSGQIGDLYESSLKRKSQVKDSGALIPGHGGVLDRIDSVIFNIPVIYYSVKWLIE